MKGLLRLAPEMLRRSWTSSASIWSASVDHTLKGADDAHDQSLATYLRHLLRQALETLEPLDQ